MNHRWDVWDWALLIVVTVTAITISVTKIIAAAT